MRVYHGTTAECIEHIRCEGFADNRPTTWYESEPDKIYFYYNADGSDDLDCRDSANRRAAIENAQITGAIMHSTSTSLYLIALDFQPDDVEDYLDYSSQNMSEIALAIPIEELEEMTYEIIEVQNAFVPSLSLMYLACVGIDSLRTDRLSDVERTLLEEVRSRPEYAYLMLLETTGYTD